jgi:ABC-type polysaccharide/polyol phosphate export permease
MTAVVESFRWILLGMSPPGVQVLASASLSLVILVTGLVYFTRTERAFADIV